MANVKRIKPKRIGNKVVIPCRLSFVHLDAPWSKNDQIEKRYCVSCIVPKDDRETIAAIEAAIEEGKQMGKAGKWNGKIPRLKEGPWYDGDETRDDEAYRNSMYFGANSKTAVPTLNRLQEPIPPQEIYSGCYGVVSVTFFPYAGAANGIGAGLNAVLLTEQGDKLGSGGNAAKDFEGMDLGVDDSLNDL